MKIQAFIPEWNSPRCQADHLLRTLEPYVERVEILEAYDVPFSEQWAEAAFKFSGDIFLWAMGDAHPTFGVGQMVEQMIALYNRGNVGIYAPNLDYTAIRYDRSKLTEFAPRVYEVANPDFVFTSLRKDVLESLPPMGINKHGWHYDYLAAAIADTLGLVTLRDYNFVIDHPYGKAYNEADAEKETLAWFKTLSVEHSEILKKRHDMHTRTSLA